MTPPRIRHVGYERDDNLVAIATDAAAAIHMGKGERALLLFYAAQSSGFRPALKTIVSATGQSRSQVCRNRAELDAHGLISVSGDCLSIHWDRAKLYASLDPRLTSKRCFFAPAGPKQPRRISLFDLRYQPLEALLPRLAALSDDDFAALCRRLKRSKEHDLHQRRYP